MASTHTNNAISDEVKGTYESECWNVGILDGNTRFHIYIERYPTSAEDFTKWKALMKTIESARYILLDESTDDHKDLKSFNDHCIPLLCNALKNNHVITTLKLLRVLNNVGMKSLCTLLQTHSTITDASFDNNRFSRSIGSYLEDLITINKTLTTLEVDVTNEDMKFVATALPHNSTLTVLDVGRWPDDLHHIDNKGLRILCEGLKRNRTITTLKLYDNHISDEGAKDLCSLCEVNHTIITIDLSANRILKLPDGFVFLTHIKRLDLTGNPNLQFPPRRVVGDEAKQNAFFADFRCGRLKFHFLLGFHERVGNNSSIQSYLWGSSIFEPALLFCIFEMVP